MDIGPDNRPFTVEEIRGHVTDLIREYQGQPGVELLGVVAGMLEHVQCTCGPIDTGRLAAVLPLRIPAPGPPR